MRSINIIVRDKIATNPTRARYVCGNSDFVIRFDFDEEWNEIKTKTARFVYGNSYQDQVFDGNECPVPIISNVNVFEVGVFAGNLRTSTSASVPADKSILCKGGMPANPAPNVYSQIMALLNNVPPKTEAPHMQLVTDKDGKATWEEKLAYKYMGEVVNLEETALVFRGEDGFALGVPWAQDIKAGDACSVVYNGKPYECIAVDGKPLMPGVPFDGVCILGNFEALGAPGMEGSNPDAPFCMITIPNAWGEAATAYAQFMPLDGAESVTLAVRSVGEIVKKIDPNLLPEQRKNIALTVDTDGNVTSDTLFDTAWAMEASELQAAITVKLQAKIGIIDSQVNLAPVDVVKAEMQMGDITYPAISVRYRVPVDYTDVVGVQAFTKEITWTRDGLSVSSFAEPGLPLNLGKKTWYLRWDGFTWTAADIDQLKADFSFVDVVATLEGTTITAMSMSFDEVNAAVQAGKTVRLKVGAGWMHCSHSTGNEVEFYTITGTMLYRVIYSKDGTATVHQHALVAD